jgi:2-hydroxy-6-oxonona-2,4-dienedioate hydrolase
MWTRVNSLLLHARVSAGPAPVGSPAVVLVHGLNISSRTMVPAAQHLAPYCRVYAPDLPGFGKSARPPHALNVAGLSDALAAWIQAVGLERVVLVSNSFGCQVTVDCAVRYPERVERMVLVGPTMDPGGRPLPRLLWRWLLDTFREPPALRRALMRDYLRVNPLRAIRTFRFAYEDHIEKKLPLVRVPTLVVRGGHDPIVSQRWAEEAARLLPMGQLVVIPGEPHAAHFSAPLELARIVKPFLGIEGQQAKERLGA